MTDFIFIDYTKESNVPTETTFSLSESSTVYDTTSSITYEGLIVESNGFLELKSSISLLHITVDKTSTVSILENAILLFNKEFNFHSGKINLMGTIIGAQNLSLNLGAIIRLYPTASWRSSQVETVINDDKSDLYHKLGVNNRVIRLWRIELDSSSGIEIFSMKEHLRTRITISCDELIMHDNNSFISANGMGIQSYGSSFITNPQQQSSSIHPVSQASGNISYGDGGWHAGRGGGIFYQYSAIGNAFYPIEFGTGGGSTFQASGGAGGGAIHIVAKQNLILNGIISANGESCTTLKVNAASNRASGGGAGGSIWIEIPQGYLTGNGKIATDGGSGCISGGGGGSGGRVAIYTLEANTSNFTGIITVNGGLQSMIDPSYGRIAINQPAGGTIFIADTYGLNGRVAASNYNFKGSDVYLYNSCTYNQTDFYTLDKIYMSTANLVIDKECSIVIENGIHSLGDKTSLFHSGKNIENSNKGFLSIKDNTNVIFPNMLDIINVTVKLDHVKVLFNNNLYIGKSGSLMVSTLNSMLIGLNMLKYHHYLDAFNYLTNISSITTNPDNYTMSFISLKNLTVEAHSSISFLSTSISGLEYSIAINAENIDLQSHGRIVASEILHNTDLSFNSIVSNKYQYYGKNSGGGYAASGGGNAGFGSSGTNNNEDYRGKPRNNTFDAKGPGGPGGTDLSSNILGGAGGGGLLFQIANRCVINGIIDVSGGSAPIGSSAGGKL